MISGRCCTFSSNYSLVATAVPLNGLKNEATTKETENRISADAQESDHVSLTGRHSLNSHPKLDSLLLVAVGTLFDYFGRFCLGLTCNAVQAVILKTI